MGSWVQIPLKLCTFFLVFLHCAVLCRQRPCDGQDTPFKEYYQLSKNKVQKPQEAATRFSKGRTDTGQREINITVTWHLSGALLDYRSWLQYHCNILECNNSLHKLLYSDSVKLKTVIRKGNYFLYPAFPNFAKIVSKCFTIWIWYTISRHQMVCLWNYLPTKYRKEAMLMWLRKAENYLDVAVSKDVMFILSFNFGQSESMLLMSIKQLGRTRTSIRHNLLSKETALKCVICLCCNTTFK